MSIRVCWPTVRSLAVVCVVCRARGVLLALMSVLTMDPSYWPTTMSCWGDVIFVRAALPLLTQARRLLREWGRGVGLDGCKPFERDA